MAVPQQNLMCGARTGECVQQNSLVILSDRRESKNPRTHALLCVWSVRGSFDSGFACAQDDILVMLCRIRRTAFVIRTPYRGTVITVPTLENPGFWVLQPAARQLTHAEWSCRITFVGTDRYLYKKRWDFS